MSCIITYNGQNFTQEDFLDYLKSQIPVLQSTKQGVEEVFQQNPELASVGTQQQYSQYLDTIFPDSKVKDIVYHITDVSGIEKFKTKDLNKKYYTKFYEGTSRILDGAFFTDNLKAARTLYNTGFTEEIETEYDEEGTPIPIIKDIKNPQFEYSTLINIKNPYIGTRNNTNNNDVKNNDSAILETIEEYEYMPGNTTNIKYTEYVVFEPEQIHILGSKQDVEGFKNFIENQENNNSSKISTSIKLPSSYKGIPIIQGPINTLKNTPVAARYRKSEGVIYADIEQIQEKFKNKAWTNPALQRDGSYATALPENQFNNITDFTKFILEREFAHSHIFKQEGETVGQYEDRINQEALKQTFQEDNISNLDTYQYYGKTYQIHTVDGVGVKVEGYMGSNVKQQALLAAYNNNKDIDPQTGRKFRNLSSLEELEQKITGNGIVTSNTLNLSKYELFPGVYANEGQKAAIDAIEEFLAGDKELFLLKGRGGTGKTTIVKKTIGEIPVKKVAGATIAYEAKNVLQENMAGYNTFTMASLIGLMPDWAKDGTMFFREKTIAERMSPSTGEISPLPIEGKKLIIVDEASMIDSFIYEKLLEKKDKDAKILFMGDNVQIPPINSRVDEDGNVIDSEEKDSPVWELVESGDYVELSERMRQGAESPILPITDLYAENVENLQNNRPGIDNPLKDRNSNFENNEGVLFTTDINEVTDQFIEDVRSSTDIREAVIVGARNAVVDEINDKVRNKLFETNEAYVIGDRLRVNSPYMEGKDLIYPNGLRVEVLAVREINTSDLGFKMFELKTSYTEIAENGSKKNIISFMRTISPKDKSLFNKKIKEMAAKAKSLPKGSLESKKAWKQFFDIKNSVVDLGYGYAITAHKVQGSTYNSTYVLEGDIMSFPGGVEQRNRMMYTAVSRPRKKLVIFNPNKVENKATTSTTSKPQSKDFITNKVNSSFDKYGYVDILTSGKNNFDFKSAVIKYILKDLGLEFKSDKELNNYLIKEKNEGRTFNLMQYVTLEELPDNKTRVKLNKRNLLLDSTEDFGPRSLGGLNFTSSGRDFESKNIFKNNIEQAFNCK